MIFEDQIEQLIKTPAKSALFLHEHPDGDSVGSCLALATVLKQYGHEVTIFSGEEITKGVRFLPGVDEIQLVSNFQFSIFNFQTYWVLDTAEPKRIGGQPKLPDEAKLVVIDHHEVRYDWQCPKIIDPNSPSTSSILFKLFKQWNVQITSEIAECLLTGIVTDTFIFRNMNTNAEVFSDVSELIKLGADYQKVIKNTLALTVNDLHYIGNALINSQLTSDGLLIITVPKRTDGDSCNLPEARDVVKTLMKEAEGAKAAVLVSDEGYGIRMSFRSIDESFDVHQLAIVFNGGGHKHAAAGKIKNVSLGETVGMVKEEYKRLISSAKG